MLTKADTPPNHPPYKLPNSFKFALRSGRVKEFF